MVEAEAGDEIANTPVQSPPTELPIAQTLGSRLYRVAAVDMRMPGGAPDHEQTIEQQFTAYTHARLSPQGADKLVFWQVRSQCLH